MSDSRGMLLWRFGKSEVDLKTVQALFHSSCRKNGEDMTLSKLLDVNYV